jgi:rubrerythrin
VRSEIDAARRHLRLLSAVVEMRELEALVASEAPKVSQLTDSLQAKEIFGRWAQDSEMHRGICQQVIERLQHKIPETEDSSGIGVSLGSSYVKKIASEILPELKKNELTTRVLYYLAEKHLILESDAERRYAEMAEMAEDPEIKKMLMELSKAEKDHHREAQTLVNLLKKTLAEET